MALLHMRQQNNLATTECLSNSDVLILEIVFAGAVKKRL